MIGFWIIVIPAALFCIVYLKAAKNTEHEIERLRNEGCYIPVTRRKGR